MTTDQFNYAILAFDKETGKTYEVSPINQSLIAQMLHVIADGQINFTHHPDLLDIRLVKHQIKTS